MADWSFYRGIRGVDNWQQRRADEKYSLQIAQQRYQQEQLKTQSQMQSQEYIQKYLDEVNKLKLLGADKKRVKAAEMEARTSIISGLKKYGGDATRFMKSGGVTMLENYKNQILQDKRVQQAMTNTSNYAQILKAQAEGKYLYKTPIRLAVKDENGKQMLDENGQPKFVTKQVGAEEQLAYFENGYTDQILYTGAEDKVKDIDYKYFLKRPKDQNNPYSKDIWVTGMDVYEAYRDHGASHQQALDASRTYEQDIQRGAKPFQWGKENTLDTQIKRQRLANMSRQAKLMDNELKAQMFDWTADMNAKIEAGFKNDAKNSTMLKDGMWEAWSNHIGLHNYDGAHIVDPMTNFRTASRGRKFQYKDLQGGRLIIDKNLDTDRHGIAMPATYIFDSPMEAYKYGNEVARDPITGKYKMNIYMDVNDHWNTYQQNVSNRGIANWQYRNQGRDAYQDGNQWSQQQAYGQQGIYERGQ